MLAAVTVCPACGGETVVAPAALAQPIALRVPAARVTAARAYVVDGRTSEITVYATGGKTDEPPVAVIGGRQTGLIQPTGVAVDSAGRIYVANTYYPGSITVFAADPSGHTRKPIAVISGGSTGIDGPTGIAIGRDGRIYVVNNVGYPSSVTVYAANPRGNITGRPLATINGSNTDIHYPLAVALGPHDEIYVLNGYGQGYVTAYAAHPRGGLNEKPRATIGGGSTAFAGPDALAIAADGDVYVANATPSNGYLGYVTVYPPPRGDFSGPPLAVIGGVRSGVQFPAGVTLDGDGEIYVTNEYANTITVYAANPVGAVSGLPIAAIHGRATELARPIGIALH
jgi:6-phosphogluconolactonase (cycloisomerase 2 family)